MRAADGSPQSTPSTRRSLARPSRLAQQEQGSRHEPGWAALCPRPQIRSERREVTVHHSLTSQSTARAVCAHQAHRCSWPAEVLVLLKSSSSGARSDVRRQDWSLLSLQSTAEGPQTPCSRLRAAQAPSLHGPCCLSVCCCLELS